MRKNLVNSPKKIVIAKGDSAATQNYWREEDKHCLTDLEHAAPCNIILPNATSVSPSEQGQLPLSNKLTARAKRATVLPELRSSSLISLGQLCDDNCNIILNKKKLTVYKDKEIVLEGKRNNQDGLWDIPIHENYVLPPTHPGLYTSTLRNIQKNIKKSYPKEQKITKKSYANVILRKKQSKVELAQYHHATCLYPTKKTFLKAIKNNHFTTWPGLDVKLIKKHLPKSMYTYQGHLNSERQGLQSTKPNIKDTVQEQGHQTTKPSSSDENEQDYFPPSDTPNQKN